MRLIGYRTIMPVLVLVCGFAEAQTDRVPRESERAPNFSITTDQGKRISPSAPGGGLLVLNFWETSCVPCVAELPSLSAFARKFRSKHVVVVAISGDEDLQKYRAFLRDHRIVLDTYRDPARRISKSFGTFMFPETYIIQDGRIIRKVVGDIDWMNEDISSFVKNSWRHKVGGFPKTSCRRKVKYSICMKSKD
jgi:cytochrome c biogenesis protein CcmG, thiol:disulfide interchange protein DsbE